MSATPAIGAPSSPSPIIYRLVGPAVVADASGGTVQVVANTKFNTNVPFDRALFITRIMYFLTWTKLPAADTANSVGSWNIFAQLTEALARTTPSATDPLYVDEWTLFAKHYVITSGVAVYTFPGLIDRPLFNPWITSAQQLNMVIAVQPNNAASGGPNVSVAPVLEYQLLPLTADLKNYIAQRIQITGQA